MKGTKIMRRVTIKDIAEIVGVDHSTVSRALKGRAGVSDETRQRILKVAEALNYVPNLNAQTLVNMESRTIGSVMTGGGSSNLVFGRLVFRLGQYAEQMGYDFLLKVGDTTNAVRALAAARVDGLLLWISGGVVAPKEEKLMTEAKRMKLPVVMVGGTMDFGYDSVETDRKKAMDMAVKHLVGLGHRNIGYIGLHRIKAGQRQQKLEGFLESMHTYGLEVDKTLLLPFGGRYEDAYNAAYTIAQNPNPCTAVVCCSDIAAIGLMLGLRDCGIKVPEDMSVIGFDDIEEAKYSLVPLTSVAQPVDDIAKSAVELLIKRIKEKKLPPDYRPEQLKLTPELIIRESCGKI